LRGTGSEMHSVYFVRLPKVRTVTDRAGQDLARRTEATCYLDTRTTRSYPTLITSQWPPRSTTTQSLTIPLCALSVERISPAADSRCSSPFADVILISSASCPLTSSLSHLVAMPCAAAHSRPLLSPARCIQGVQSDQQEQPWLTSFGSTPYRRILSPALPAWSPV
jgi:hypothetical protein